MLQMHKRKNRQFLVKIPYLGKKANDLTQKMNQKSCTVG